MKDIRQFIQITDGIAEPLRRGFLQKLDEIEQKTVKMTKEEAIEFAKKYLANRREQWIKEHIPKDQIWDVAAEYILYDIIPYLYGEALD